nr:MULTISPECIES: helix-turn-helix domain-containing protein [unclassified Facklamia]
MQPLQQIIRQNNEYSSLIQALFEHQGNLSQAAEQLYIHRNTLTYRLQKFYKETGMQLQHLPDLVICYLCLF